MNKQQHSRRVLVAALLGFVLAGCSHNASPSAQVHSAFAPFSSTRNQVIGLVAGTKRLLGAQDVNTLAVAYTALQQKANAYAGFMAEAIATSSFDAARNARYAADLATAIAAFDKSFDGLTAVHRPALASAWVPSFAQGLQARWDSYNGLIAKMSPQMKADAIADLKRETVWPNYEDIATESVVGSR